MRVFCDKYFLKSAIPDYRHDSIFYPSVIYTIFSFVSDSLRWLSNLSARCAQRWLPPDIHEKNVIRSTEYDMVLSPDEEYYGDQYWRVLNTCITNLPKNSICLDLGCGQGRFALRLADQFPDSRVIACDISSRAIKMARAHAEKRDVGNIDYRVQTITDCLTSLEDNAVDLILMLEVAFFHPCWKKDLSKALHILKPGGYIAVSFRPQYFYALSLVKNRFFWNIEMLVNKREGNLFGAGTLFTWQTSEEIIRLLEKEYGLELLDIRGIGVCSGISGDPHSCICRPSLLEDRERDQLMDLELELGKSLPDGGRYILAVAKKS